MTASWLAPPHGALARQAARIAAVLPVIETARLRLRAAQIGDYPAYEEICFDGRWHGLDAGDGAEDAWLDFCQMVAGWLLRGTGLFAIEDKRTGALLGFVPLNHEWGDPELELGWFVTRDAEGQGFASEAAAAVRAHAATEWGCTGLVSYVSDGNARSIRVAQRLGAVRDKQAETGVEPGVRVYRHPRAGARP